MTHQYTAADFEKLPKKVLDALDVWVCWKPEFDRVAIQFAPPSDEHQVLLLPDNAAALLVGLVMQRCQTFEFASRADGSCLGRLVLDEPSFRMSPPVDCPTMMDAVFFAYSVALEGK